MSFERVLVATDLDPASRDVLASAVARLASPSAALAFCHVRWAPERHVPGRPPDVTAELDREAEAELAAFTDGCLPGRARELLIRSGAPFAGIIRAAESFAADLVVMGATRTTGLRRAILGSVTSRVVENTSTAVLVARPDNGSSLVVAATDLTDDSLPSVRAAFSVSVHWGGWLAVAHVVHPSTDAVARQAARDSMHLALGRLGATRATAEILDGDVIHAFASWTREREAGLAVVSPRGRSKLARLVLGRRARGMIDAVQCSVLVVPRRTPA